MSAPSSRSPDRTAGGTGVNRTRVLAVMCVALALVVSAVASLNVALPNIARDTGASQTQLQWLVDAYAVVFAALLLPAGAFGDRFGRKGVLVVGLAVFGAAYAAGGAMSDPGALIGARAVAGLGAAMVMPATLSIITSVFPPQERARAVGTWAGVAGAGAMAGLLVSGVLLEVASWEWVFVANAISAGLALVATAVGVPTSKDPEEAPLDPLGAILSVLGLSALVFAIIEGPEQGWNDALVVSGFALSALLLAAFVLWELRLSRPMLDPRLFRRRRFLGGTVSVTLQFFGFFGFVFLVLQYLQLVRGYSPLEAALALVPMALLVGGLSQRVAPRLVERAGIRAVNAPGLAMMAVGFAVLATLSTGSSYWHLFAGIVPVGAGMGLAAAPATTAITSSLPLAKQGVASAVNDTAREVGGALGIAVLGSVVVGSYRSGVDEAVAGLPPQARERALESPGFVLQAAERFGERGARIADAAQTSFVNGFSWALIVAACVLVAGAIVVFLRGAPAGDAPDAADGTRPAHTDGAGPERPTRTRRGSRALTGPDATEARRSGRRGS